MVDISRLLTVKNYAKQVNKPVQRIYQLIALERINTVNIDGYILIDKDAVIKAGAPVGNPTFKRKGADIQQ